jgi:hypothetical protein
LPQEVLSFKPGDDIIYQCFKDGDRERKIHCNVKLADAEQEQLRILQAEARAQGKVFSPTVAAMATRFLDHARGDVKLAVATMQRTQDWRADYFKQPLRDEVIGDFLRHGVVYWIGRDKCLRPTLVVRGKRIPQECYQEKNFDGIIDSCIFCIEYFLRYMVVPGRVEGMNIIIDLEGVQMSQVPVSALKGIQRSLSNNSPGRVNKFYICHLSFFLRPLIGIVKAVLTVRQTLKLQFVSDVKELREDFALHQLETDLGGLAPVATRFLPFPLQSGPFEAGFTGGAGPDMIAGVHEILTAAGSMGRLWDPKLSSSENLQLDYSSKASEIFLKCGLQVPPECKMTCGEKPDLRRSTRLFFEKLGTSRMLSRFNISFASTRVSQKSACSLHNAEESVICTTEATSRPRVLLGSASNSHREKDRGFGAWRKNLDRLRTRSPALPSRN